METKIDTGNNVSGLANWETFEKHARAMKVAGKTLPRFADILLKLTGQSSVPGSRVPFLQHFACKGGLSLTLLTGNLLACKQGLRKLQISFSVHQLTHVKLSEVILHQTAYQTMHNWL